MSTDVGRKLRQCREVQHNKMVKEEIAYDSAESDKNAEAGTSIEVQVQDYNKGQARWRTCKFRQNRALFEALQLYKRALFSHF